MLKVNVNGTNIGTIESNLSNFTKNIMDATMDQLHIMATNIIHQSQIEVPKDTTALVNSAFIVEEDNSIIMGYGGPNTKINPKTGMLTEEYALLVHEDLNMQHLNGGKAKFLEDPFREVTSDLETNLVQPLQSIFK